MSPLWCMLRLWSVQRPSIICFEWANSPPHFCILLRARCMQLCTRNMKYSAQKYVIDATPPVFFLCFANVWSVCVPFPVCLSRLLSSHTCFIVGGIFFLNLQTGNRKKARYLPESYWFNGQHCGHTDSRKQVEANTWLLTVGQRSAQGSGSNWESLGCSSKHNRPSRFSLLNYTAH